MIRPIPLALLIISGGAAALAAAPRRKPPVKKPPARRPADGKTPATPPPTAARPGELVLSGPIDVLLLERRKHAQLRYTELEQGALPLVFDGNPRTFARTVVPPSGPRQGFYQVALDAPRAVDEVDVAFGDTAAHRWSLAAADTPADMQARRGSYKLLVSPRTVQGKQDDRMQFTKPRAYKVYRLECEGLDGDGGVAVAEWTLWAPQRLSVMEVAAPAPEVGRGGLLPLRVNATFDAGGRQNMTPDVTWEISPRTRGTVDAFSRFDAAEAGPTRITAIYRGIRSRPLDVNVVADGKPDWDVTCIERQPRVDYESSGELKAGQNVTWFAHVKNYGTLDAGPVEVEWRVDGQSTRTDRLPKVPRFGQTEALFTQPWDGMRHEIEVIVDPKNEVAETCDENNRRKIYTDALSVGFWVEESLVRYFHCRQRELGAGSNSWEDWAQRQIDFWNQAMEKAAGPPAGDAPREHWRLDRVTVVGDGMLPLAGGSPVNAPDARDHSVNLMLGFPAYEGAFSEQYAKTSAKSPDNAFFIQQSLLGAMSQVKYHQLVYRPAGVAMRAAVRDRADALASGSRVRPFDRRMRPPR